FKVSSNFGAKVDPKLASHVLAPRRQDIFGHYLNLDDGRIVGTGRFAQNMSSLKGTVDRLQCGKAKASPPIKHLLIFAHGAMTTRRDSAKRIRAWKNVFLANGIYPLHIMWQTGFNSGIVDLIGDVLLKTRDRMGDHAERRDERLEELARPLGRKLWRDLKVSAEKTFEVNSDGARAMREVLAALYRNPQIQIHFTGVSAGSYLLAELTQLVQGLRLSIRSATLFAPACNIRHYEKKIRNRVGPTIKSLMQFNLSPDREANDSVDIYGKSLLHLVSNALEIETDRRLLGLQRDVDGAMKGPLARPHAHVIHVAGQADTNITDATTHHGFERDVATMNTLLNHILGDSGTTLTRFSEDDLHGY
ncbi:MAG: hypothetical protein AAFY31_17970, partial [Pseudomonadota bacterium]